MKVSVIGTGLMGTAIAEVLLKAGYQVTVFNRTRTKTAPLRHLGAVVADSAAEALLAADFTILVLFDAASTKEVLMSDDARAALRGRALINIAATTPDEIIALAHEVSNVGGHLADMVVVGYPEHVRRGDTSYLISSDSERAAAWCKIFRDLSPNVHHIGAVGNASKAEMALWLPYMFHTVAAAYALGAFEKLGLPVGIVRALLTDNPVVRVAGADRSVDQMSRRSYGSKMWTVDNFVASCDMIIEFARNMNMPTQVFSDIKDIYVETSKRGFGGEDVTAIYEAINAAGPSPGR
jgi:3-hydroxyisobutyrate dehydrogenase-like beta-hydroxyacid dehydrogenase